MVADRPASGACAVRLPAPRAALRGRSACSDAAAWRWAFARRLQWEAAILPHRLDSPALEDAALQGARYARLSDLHIRLPHRMPRSRRSPFVAGIRRTVETSWQNRACPPQGCRRRFLRVSARCKITVDVPLRNFGRLLGALGLASRCRAIGAPGLFTRRLPRCACAARRCPCPSRPSRG